MSDTRDTVNGLRERIDGRLKQIVERCGYPDELKKVISYALFTGGKRLRPVLFCAWHLMFAELDEAAIDFACGIELFHTFTLIHDDLPCIDNDDFRRGKPSVHKAFGENKAVLAGDALFSLAYSTMLGACSGAQYELVALVSKLFGDSGVITGQYDDVFYSGTKAADVIKIYERKTAALLYGACVCGALFPQAKKEDEKRLKEFISDNKLAEINEICHNTHIVVAPAAQYGYNFGVAFQLYDDLSEYLAGEHADGASVLEYMDFNRARQKLGEHIEKAKLVVSYDGIGAYLRELADRFNIK